MSDCRIILLNYNNWVIEHKGQKPPLDVPEGFSPMTMHRPIPKIIRSAHRSVMESAEMGQLLTTFSPADALGLTTALANAQLDDIIIHNAGGIYTCRFPLQNKTTGSGWITLVSSNIADLPVRQRVTQAEASDVLSYSNGVATFSGQTVDATAVLVKHTYIGDANLSGKMDGDDSFRMDSGYAGGVPSFLHGDFNLDGKINADDYVLLDSKMNKQTVVL